jgi:putative sterol carrier protein
MTSVNPSVPTEIIGSVAEAGIPEAEAAANPTVVLRMTADDGHRFWLGKLNLTMAMAQRKVKMEGSAAKALKLLPLTKPLFASYERLLRDRGRDDLLQR